MKVRIETHLFDTNKASHHWDLYGVIGDLYRSSKGYWYVHLAERDEDRIPFQWPYQHTWLLISSAHALSEYDRYLRDDEKAEIAELARLDQKE